MVKNVCNSIHGPFILSTALHALAMVSLLLVHSENTEPPPKKLIPIQLSIQSGPKGKPGIPPVSKSTLTQKSASKQKPPNTEVKSEKEAKTAVSGMEETRRIGGNDGLVEGTAKEEGDSGVDAGASGGDVGGDGENTVLGSYLAEVRLTIEKRKFYPLLAQRMNIEGRVELEILLDQTGKILQSKIITSSQKAELDSAALKTMENIQKFSPFPPGLNRESLRIVLPLIFKIHN